VGGEGGGGGGGLGWWGWGGWNGGRLRVYTGRLSFLVGVCRRERRGGGGEFPSIRPQRGGGRVEGHICTKGRTTNREGSSRGESRVCRLM